jgi:hypothetical protein
MNEFGRYTETMYALAHVMDLTKKYVAVSIMEAEELRQRRSDAAKRGWETRRARTVR